MIVPKPLKPGDTIGFVSPSSPASAERVFKGKEMLEAMGYQVKVADSCFQKLHGYLAGTAKQRADDLNDMFANPEIDAIFCVRGGYGSSEVMDLLDYDLIKRNPKIFVGYSDITNLHAAMNTLCDLITVHGPMVSSNLLEHYDDYTRTCFQKALSMPSVMKLENPIEESMKVIVPGTACGSLIGGNLALLINMLGTFYAPKFEGNILFFEDIFESVPRVHRMLDQLRLLGVFNQVAGVLVGDFSECRNEDDESYLIQELLYDFFHECKIPVITNVKCGHCYQTASLLMGAECSIKADDCGVQIRMKIRD